LQSDGLFVSNLKTNGFAEKRGDRLRPGVSVGDNLFAGACPEGRWRRGDPYPKLLQEA
jgi:hypothetical protein